MAVLTFFDQRIPAKKIYNYKQYYCKNVRAQHVT